MTDSLQQSLIEFIKLELADCHDTDEYDAGYRAAMETVQAFMEDAAIGNDAGCTDAATPTLDSVVTTPPPVRISEEDGLITVHLPERGLMVNIASDNTVSYSDKSNGFYANSGKDADKIAVLPYDVEIAHIRFRKGVALETLIRAARRWHGMASEMYNSGMNPNILLPEIEDREGK